LKHKEPVDEACQEAARVYAREYTRRKAQPKLSVVPAPAPAPTPHPVVRCPWCKEREVIEYPVDSIATKFAMIRHFAKREDCFRKNLKAAEPVRIKA
jgi:hypothetical protein